MAETRTLAALVERLDAGARERDDALQALGLARADYPRLPALDDFRRLHGQLRAREQLRETLKPPPANAGPLNSASLAHRALALMHATSPGYLQHFLGYLDTLSWLEQMQPAAPARRKRRAAPRKKKQPAGPPPGT